MKQELPVEDLARHRIRGLRLARGWSLEALASRCHMSTSTLSRIETGHRRIALDQLVALARALDATLDQLLEPPSDEDVVIRPESHSRPGMTMWMLSREGAVGGATVAKIRLAAEPPPADQELKVHPGWEWLTVLSGTLRLQLGERVMLIEPGQAAEFTTMTPHALHAHGGPVEMLIIFDREGERAHLHPRT
ncbi:helix-turn-helix domain-containing protein [Sediminivirga luteola]|uniref:helix-turn-helix domain-containing protein n=1 Tax=Sediminivirga luteola TaxID=1774748 RepID=UPI00166B2A64|nr:XRE family transcriptional regulator [Sediminivirga luteola]